MTTLTEADFEQAALILLSTPGWQVAHVSDIAPDKRCAEFDEYREVVTERRPLDELLPGLVSGNMKVRDIRVLRANTEKASK